jgi:purine nucleoside permease
MTAEEDNATLEALLRATLAGLVDFSRIIVMRSGSDFDRPPPGMSAYDNLFSDAGGFEPSLINLYNVGSLIAQGIVDGWDTTFEAGIPRKS